MPRSRLGSLIATAGAADPPLEPEPPDELLLPPDAAAPPEVELPAEGGGTGRSIWSLLLFDEVAAVVEASCCGVLAVGCCCVGQPPSAKPTARIATFHASRS